MKPLLLIILMYLLLPISAQSQRKTPWQESLSANTIDPVLNHSIRHHPKNGASFKPFIRRNFLYLIPCEAELINGIAIGAWPENLKNNNINQPDSLTINGLTLEINPFWLYSVIMGFWNNRFIDSIEMYRSDLALHHDATTNGINISITGSINSVKANGIYIGGINTLIDEINGFAISGLNCSAYITRGLTLSLRNRSAETRGVQIGLFNRSADLRGIQIGLWNRNAKRSLPIINWQFGKKKDSR